MKVVVSAAQAKMQDAAYRGDLGEVMERAGFAVAAQAARMGAGYGTRVAVLAGTGNNGGDGYVAARHLARRGAKVVVYALGAPRTPEAAAAADAWRDSGGAVSALSTPQPADLIVDAVFGVGFRGELPPQVVAWGEVAAPALAVDVASGLDATTGEVAAGTLPAEHTVALSNFKLGHFLGSGPELSGRVTVADLGLPPAQASMLLCEATDAPRPLRDRDAHKWSAGAVAVVGGSAGMAGAAVLAAKSSLSFGAGAVATFVPGDLAAELDAAHPEIMTNGIGSGSTWDGIPAADVAGAVERFDAVVIGPGLGAAAEQLVEGLLATLSQPVILDADGINSATPQMLAARSAHTVITPHAGEFVRLAGTAAGWEAAAMLAEDTSATVLLKGPATTIAARGETPWLVTSGGAELATVGTGDVLAGMIGALVARGLTSAVAARSAAYWHGVAGADLADRGSVTADALVAATRRYVN